MTGSETAFVAVGAVGFLLLLISLVLGEFAGHGLEFSHEVEAGHIEGPGHIELHGPVEAHAETGGGADGTAGLSEPSWLSFRVIAASAVGFGAFGFIAASLGLPPFLSWPVAAVGFGVVGATTFYAILKPLARQQYNSLMSRYSYVGREAVVTLDILPGGSGQVTFHDRQGARVTQNATADVPDAVVKGSLVRIIDLAGSGVVVHRSLLSD